MDRMISLSVGTDGAEDYFGTFQDISELANNLGKVHDYVTVTAHKVDEDPDGEGKREECYYDENTLLKAHSAIRGMGLDEEGAFNVITALQNAGILFRERPKSKGE